MADGDDPADEETVCKAGREKNPESMEVPRGWPNLQKGRLVDVGRDVGPKRHCEGGQRSFRHPQGCRLQSRRGWGRKGSARIYRKTPRGR